MSESSTITSDNCFNWSTLPSPVLCRIISMIKDENLSDFVSLCQTCKHWRQAAFNADVWRQFRLSITTSQNNNNCSTSIINETTLLNICQAFMKFVQVLTFNVDQSESKNRTLAVKCLEMFMHRSVFRRHHRLKICFTQQNPLFYAGQEFVDVLTEIFSMF